MSPTRAAAIAACAALAAAGAAPWALGGATRYGSVDPDLNTVILRGGAEAVQFTGTVRDAGQRHAEITVTRPGGEEEVLGARVFAGSFGATYTVEPGYESGTYYFSGESGGLRLGQGTFRVIILGAADPAPARQPAPAPAPPAPPVPLTVTTDRSVYGAGDAVTVYGSGPAWKEILVRVTGPGGAVAAEGRTPTGGSGAYGATIDAAVMAAAADGTYTVTASHGGSSVRSSFLLAARQAAQPAALLTVTTDRAAYTGGDIVTVSGSGPAGQDVVIMILDPAGAIIGDGRVTIGAGGTYRTGIDTAGMPATAGGTYEVAASGGGQSARSSFALSPPSSPQPAAQIPAVAAAQTQQPDIAAYVAVAAIAAIGAAAVAARKRIGRGLRPPAATAPAFPSSGSASIMSFYECPRCYSPDIHNRPDGGAHCRNCGFAQ